MLAWEQKRSSPRSRSAAQSAKQRPTLPQSTRPLVQRAATCACGGTCPRCQTKSSFTIGASDDAYEREADQIADQVMAEPPHSPVTGAGGAGPRIQRFSGPANQHTDAAPASVRQALDSPGRPLEPALRQDMERSFGHDFSRVRVHTGGVPEQSARDVNAHAYTVGQDIVFGRGQYPPQTKPSQRLLAHELSHVVQQSDLAPTPSILQRSGFGEVRSAEGALAGEAKPPPSGVAGLPEPDCSTRVSDVFLLGAIYCPQRPECCFAQVHDRKDHARNDIFRADYLLEGKPDCEYGDQKHHDYWLGNQWRIVDITTSHMTVMNMCGIEESLGIESTQESGGPRPVEAQPERSVAVSQSNFGPGTVKIFDECQRVVFEPDDPSQMRREYRLETWTRPGLPEMKVYVPQQDKPIPYAPLDLSSMLKVYLLGDKCGTPVPPQVPNESEGGE